MNTEIKRKAVHIGMVVVSLLVGRVPPILITAGCLVAFLFNWLVLPRLTKRQLERDHELARGYSLGILLYPAVLFLLSLVFFNVQVFLVVAWSAMAFGDGLAGLVGSSVGGPKLAWNRDKSWAGFAAFAILGTALTFGWLYLLPQATLLDGTPQRWLVAVASGCLAAAWVETLPGTVDDNLVVPITAASVAYSVFFISGLYPLPSLWPWGLALTLLLVVGSIATKKINVPGGLVGGLLAWCIFLGFGLHGMALLFAFFLLGSIASSWGKPTKSTLGLAQEDEGRRSIRHALANALVAAVAGLLAWLYPAQTGLFQALVAAALASATADTLSSELGNLYGRRFVNILTLTKDQRGLDGVVSLEGSLIGVLGALFIAFLYALSTGLPYAALAVGLAGVVGNTADSVLGATLQRRHYMTNDTVNFANTLIAAVTMAALWLLLPLT